MSPNVIRCPKCDREIGEEEATFKAVAEDTFDIICGLCGHTWTSHHRMFYRRGSDGPQLPNPFKPIHIPLG